MTENTLYINSISDAKKLQETDPSAFESIKNIIHRIKEKTEEALSWSGEKTQEGFDRMTQITGVEIKPSSVSRIMAGGTYIGYSLPEKIGIQNEKFRDVSAVAGGILGYGIGLTGASKYILGYSFLQSLIQLKFPSKQENKKAF